MFDKWVEAITSGDVAKVDALLADDFSMTSIRSGKTYDKTQVLEWYSNNTNDVRSKVRWHSYAVDYILDANIWI